jgi:hypothetical protein
MFGRMMSPGLGKLHFWLTFVFYNLTFFPMHQLGLQGHMRRIYDPTIYEFLQPLGGLNRLITISAFLLFASQILFIVAFIGGWFRGRKATDNPWEDTGLEWTTPSPPPHGNWARTPACITRPTSSAPRWWRRTSCPRPGSCAARRLPTTTGRTRRPGPWEGPTMSDDAMVLSRDSAMLAPPGWSRGGRLSRETRACGSSSCRR